MDRVQLTRELTVSHTVDGKIVSYKVFQGKNHTQPCKTTRYSELAVFDKEVKREVPGFKADLPPKTLRHQTNDEFVKTRRDCIETYLHQAVGNSSVTGSQAWIKFLSDAVDREALAGSASAASASGAVTASVSDAVDREASVGSASAASASGAVTALVSDAADQEAPVGSASAASASGAVTVLVSDAVDREAPVGSASTASACGAVTAPVSGAVDREVPIGSAIAASASGAVTSPDNCFARPVMQALLEPETIATPAVTDQSQRESLHKSPSTGSLSTKTPSAESLTGLALGKGRQTTGIGSSVSATSKCKDSSIVKRLLSLFLYARPSGGWWARVFALMFGACAAARYRKIALTILMGIVARNGYFHRKAVTKEILLNRISQIPMDKGDLFARDGTLIHWYASGPVDGPVIVLCNGIGCRVNFWAESIRELGKTYRVLMWDYRGTFRSGNPAGHPGQLSIRDHASDLDDLLVHLKISKAYAVLGWSMGVQVAIQFAASYAHRCDKLVLVTGTDKNVQEIVLQPLFRIPGLAAVLPDLVRALREDASVMNLASQFLASPSVMMALRLCVFKPWAMVYGSRDFEWIFSRYFEEIFAPVIPHRCDMVKNYIQNAEELSAHSAHHLIPQLPQEVLVMTGMLDVLTPAYKSFEMHRRLQRSRLECWNLATHFIPCEFPESFVNTLGLFLDAANLVEYDEWKRHGRRLQ